MTAKANPPLHVLRDYFDLIEPDGLLIWRKARRKTVVGKEAGHTMNIGYRQVRIPGYGTYLTHRVITAMRGIRVEPDDFIDHINGVRDDNRACNLRVVTRRQNAANRLPNKNTSTGYQGVTPFKGRDGATVYRARLVRNKQCISLGLHPTPEQAHAAYLQARKAIPHG